MSSHHDPSKSAAERLHELQLRQGELERQNQELRRAQAEQDASRARYFDLYDQAPIGYCTISEPGLIIEANLVAATQLGLPRDTLPGQTFIQFIVNEDQDSYHLYRRQLSEAGGPQTCELRLVKTNGSTFWAHLAMTVANANGAPVCRIVLSDISERKRVEDIQLFLSQNEPGDACENFFQGLARHLAQSLGMDYVCIDRLLGDGAVAKTLAIYHDGKFKDNVTYSLKDTPGSDVLGKGTCCFAKDACHLFPQHAVLQELQAESYAGTALRSSSGLPIGLIAVIGQKTLENQLLAETILKLVAARAADELERQQAEEALRESELQYRTLADSGQALIWTAGLDKKCNYFNRPWLDFTGRTLEQELGDGWTEGVHPDDLARCFEIYTNAFDRRDCFSMDYRIRHHDGSWRWIQDDGSPRHDIHGNFTGYIGHCLDITGRMQADEARQKSEAHLRTLLNTIPDLIWFKDVDGIYRECNRRFEQFFGATEKEIAGKTDYDYVNRELADAFREHDRRAQAAGQPTVNEELITFANDGHQEYLETIKTPIRSSAGEIIGVLGIGRDISKRKRAENELQQHREHLEELVAQRTTELAEAHDLAQTANRAKSSFLANMSHELRTPLTAILGFSEILSLDPTISGKSRKNLTIINNSGKHLLELINDILDLSKIDAGRVKIECQDVHLNELIHDVIDMMRGRAEAKGLRLVLDPASKFPRLVNTDPAKLRQILVNLIGNAIKFTVTGQVTISLATESTPKGHSLAIEVRDTGIGISRSDLDRIFLPFEQIGTQVSTGTGLGLAITRQHVEMLGGRISVDSETGQGSCFRFTIPTGQTCQANAETLPGHRQAVGIGSPTADLRLLIVEDQNENRQLLRCFLEPCGFQLREAVNGAEAVAIFQKWHPHLILMDRRMPVLDGLTATQQIRALPDGASPVIIAVSAHSFKEEQQEMLAAGCNAFLSKPFGKKDILALLSQHLHLDLVYADGGEEPQASPRQLPADALRDLPPDARATLHHLAMVCDDSELAKWLEAQDSLAPFTKAELARLIAGYQFEAIQKLSAPPAR